MPSAPAAAERRIAPGRAPRAKRPKFLQVERRFVAASDLGPQFALALAAIAYRARLDQRVDVPTLEAWFGWSRWKVWRTLRVLRERSLITQDNALGPAYHTFEGPGGHLRVGLELIPLGDLEAVALTQLASWGSLAMVHRRRGFAEVRQRALARFLGCCARTVGALLERLASGLTVGVRRAQRRGRRPEVRPLLELAKTAGRATYMRLLGEREALRRSERPTPPPAAAEAEQRFVPELDGLLDLAAAATRAGPAPAPTA